MTIFDGEKRLLVCPACPNETRDKEGSKCRAPNCSCSPTTCGTSPIAAMTGLSCFDSQRPHSMDVLDLPGPHQIRAQDPDLRRHIEPYSPAGLCRRPAGTSFPDRSCWRPAVWRSNTIAESGAQGRSGKATTMQRPSNRTSISGSALIYIDLNAVRAGIVRHPADWPFCGFQEIAGLRASEMRLIDKRLLMELLGMPKASEGWQTDIRIGSRRPWPRVSMSRQPAWTESVAVGKEDFVKRIHGELGLRAVHKETVNVAGGFVLREPPGLYLPYRHVFGMENVD
jgi:hypothetical protein